MGEGLLQVQCTGVDGMDRCRRPGLADRNYSIDPSTVNSPEVEIPPTC